MEWRLPSLPLDFHPLIAEAKRRARRRRLLVAAVALLAAGTGTGIGLTAGAGGGPGEIPWLPTRPQLGPANPPLAPPCTASQLHATLSLQGATQTLVGGVLLSNRSSQPCSLLGRPKLSFAGATSRWRLTAWKGSTDLVHDPLAPPRGTLRALVRGRHVEIGISWSNWCGRGSSADGNAGRPPAAIVLSAPGGGAILLARNRPGSRAVGLGAPPCNVRAASTLAATRYTPVVPQLPRSSRLPLRVRIVSGAQIVEHGKTIAEPGMVVRRGSWHSYTVVLTNRARRTFRFGRKCPVYTEGFGGLASQQAYVLNCRPVGSIAPGRSVRFAMRIRVPRRLPLSAPSFGWTLAPHTWNAPEALAVVQLR